MTRTTSNITSKTFDITWLLSIAQDQPTKDAIEKICKWNDDIKNGIFNPSDEVFSLKLGKHTIWLRESEAWFAIHLYDHIFKEKEHLLCEDFDGKGCSTVVDMGANIGMYSLAIADNNPECKIISFEPNPKAYELLCKNIESNNAKNVTLVNRGVSENGTPFDMKTLDEGSAYGGKYLGEIKNEYRMWIQQERYKNIKVQSLSVPQIFAEYSIDTIDILKMDIEGMELEVLEGAVPMFPKIKKIVFEWHDHAMKDEIVTLLTGNGFNMVFDDGREYGNLYFVNSAL